MAETLKGFGKLHCSGCRAAPYSSVFGTRADICQPCLRGLQSMVEAEPERILSYDAVRGEWSYTLGIKAGTEDQDPAGGDHDVRYIFGRPPTTEDTRMFTHKQFVSLLKLRTEVQDMKISAHSANQDGL